MCQSLDKKCINDLAIWGGQPLFDNVLHVGQPNVGDRRSLLKYISGMLDDRWLSNNGPLIQELEQRLADLFQVKHCIAMCNGTTALEVVIRASDLNGEVIVPSFTFIATAHALKWLNIEPVFCDIDPKTHHMDVNKAEALISAKTSGIIGVHLWGRPCDVDGLTRIAKKHGLKILFDAAHAISCSHNGRMIGNFGDAEVFSFHATKVFNTFEGGAVTTNDDELARKIRLMKNFGFSGYDNVIEMGINGKMSEASAAMGLVSLDNLKQAIGANYSNYILYQRELGHVPGIRMITYDEEFCNYQYIVIEIEEKIAEIGRDLLLSILHAENVLARRYFYPGCHRMEPYRSCFPNAGEVLPHTEELSERVLILPTGPSVQKEQIVQICQILKLAIKNAREIKKRLI